MNTIQSNDILKIIKTPMISESLLILVLSITCLKYLRYLNLDSWKSYLSACFILANPYFISMLQENMTISIQKTSLFAYIVLYLTRSTNHSIINVSANIFISISIFINPINILFLILLFKNQSKDIFQTSLFVSLCYCFQKYLFQEFHFTLHYYEEKYFPQTFEPQMNLIWLVFSHMFTRYLHLYQFFFLGLQITALFIIRNIKMHMQLKILILISVNTFCTYECTQTSVSLYLAAHLLLKKISQQYFVEWKSKNMMNKIITFKILTLVLAIVNIIFWVANKFLLKMYLNSHMIGVSYIFFYFAILWGVNSVCLSEIIQLIELNDEDEIKCDKESLISKGKKYIGERIKNI